MTQTVESLKPSHAKAIRDLRDHEIPETRQAVFSRLKKRDFPFWKRIFDICASLLLLVVLSPLLVVIAAFIRIVSGGPVLFRQTRLGYRGHDFEILKFRTLYPSDNATETHREFIAKLSLENGIVDKPDLSKRLIPGGRFLRSWSLDELPQLVNVLRGEMSLIGPRPDVLEWYDYDEWQLRRFETLPGITGLWQVNGKNRLTFRQMIEWDIKYVDSRSPWLDSWIALKTVRVLLFRDNG